MYTISVEITNQCNLNCSYCYLGQKKNYYMDTKTFKEAINLSIQEASKEYDRKILVDFIGGEPLLVFSMIKWCVAYVEKECKKYGINPFYSITTNGTLLNDDIVIFLTKYKFSLKVSIDGDRVVHDLNRRDYNGKGSYEKIFSILSLIRDYSKWTGRECIIANVITKNNYSFLIETLKHIKTLGFLILESEINIYEEWNDRDIDKLIGQIESAMDYYIFLKRNGEKFYWSFLEKRIHDLFNEVSFYSCKAGLKSIFVTAKGDIYPCSEIDEDIKMGNVFEGLKVEKVREFAGIKNTQNEECLKCSDLKHCKTCGCMMNNYEFHRDYFQPIKINCIINRDIMKKLRKKLTSYEKLSFEKHFMKK